MIPDRALSIAALGLLVACSSKEHAEPGARASASAPAAVTTPAVTAAIPTPPPAAPKDAAVRWVSTVPSRPSTARPGDRVWAVVPIPGQETASFGVVEVDAVQGDTATTWSLVRVDGKLRKDEAFAPVHLRTPAALFSPALSLAAAKIKAGDVVIAPIFGYHTTVAHVVKITGEDAEVTYVHGDKVKHETTPYAAPLATGVAPFAFVAVKSGASYREVLVTAVIGDQVFGLDESGDFVKAAKSEVRPLDVQFKDRKKGDKVIAFDASGSAETTIDVVSVTKWVYQVKIDGVEKRLPFHALVDKI